jgi:hypothetical protein
MNYNSEQYGFEQIKAKKTYKPKIRKNKSSEKSLTFSKKIIAALEDKAKAHNENNIKQVKLSELKKAYKSGFNGNKDLNKETLANVNMFIRLSRGEASDIFKNLKSSLFEISGSEFIIKGDLVPGELDYQQAEQDIISYGLEDFDFKSQEELYLEDEEDRVIYGFDIDKI